MTQTYLTLIKSNWILKMSSWLIVVTGLIYGYIAVEQGFKGNMAMLVIYGGYAFSNIGLYLMAAK